MKAVILAGGLGSRLAEETQVRPKPMVEIGGKPILWHIMKAYSAHGITNFVVCLGYKGYLIKEYFANYYLHTCDVSFDLAGNSMEVHQSSAEDWRVTLVDTGEATQTGGRLKRVGRYLDDEDFCFTYGDGVADIDITALVAFHRAHGRIATVTGVRPPGRFGVMRTEAVDGLPMVRDFAEKPQTEAGLINGGFFVFEPGAFAYLSDSSVLEREPLEGLAEDDQLRAFRHTGFWDCMDTYKDAVLLDALWAAGRAPWKRW